LVARRGHADVERRREATSRNDARDDRRTDRRDSRFAAGGSSGFAPLEMNRA
jgi:hypothetical protein